MKTLNIIALLFISITANAQTVSINGVLLTVQNQTISSPNPLVHVDIPVNTTAERVWEGVTTPHTADVTLTTTVNPKLLRINFFNKTKKYSTFRVYLKK